MYVAGCLVQLETINTRNKSELEANTCNRRQARENACDQVTIGFSLASDWLRKWREFFKPIRERSKAKPMQTIFMFSFKSQFFLYICSFLIEKG